MFAAVALMGCATTPKAGIIPNSSEAEAAIETAIRRSLKKPTGDLTKADLEKVKGLYLGGNRISDLSPLAGLKELEGLSLPFNRITDLTPLAGLTGLKMLWLDDNPNLTKAEIYKLQKALPKCKIRHSAQR